MHMRYTVNISDIEEALIFLGGEAKSKAIKNRVFQVHCVGVIPENYKSEKSFRNTIQSLIEDYCPQSTRFNSKKREAKFIRIGHDLYRHAGKSGQNEFLAIEEVENTHELLEGTIKTIWVNAFERNLVARKKCLDHYGYACIVCGFDFEKTYGESGKAFIHVHHLRPLSEIRDSYEVDPIMDLVPLCANCHAIVHRTSEVMPLERLREILLVR